MQKQQIATSVLYLFTRRCVMSCMILFVGINVTAQFTVTIQLKPLAAGHENDAVFVAGSFNGWNPGSQQFVEKNNQPVTSLKNVAAGKYEFKFTRGTWDKVECTVSGKDVENHSVQINSDTTLVYSIEAWKDDFAAAVRSHTASVNVQVLDTAFEIPQLKRHRRIWIYFPPGYQNNNQHYPVMYMQDGQNLFDELTAPFGEWGVDECLDSLINKGKAGCIIVGIDNGGDTRMSEYNPFEFTWKDGASAKTFAAEGDRYLDFITQTLKPYIDQHYRTIPKKENTIIAGSSMGGLIAYYAALKYPDVFGKAGIFSPAFWTADGIDALTDSLSANLKGKYFFYMGGKEGAKYIDNMIRIQEKVAAVSGAMIYSFIDPAADHNEQAWRKWFAEFYNFIMADGFNVITGGEN